MARVSVMPPGYTRMGFRRCVRNAIVAPALQNDCRLRPDERNLGALVFVLLFGGFCVEHVNAGAARLEEPRRASR